MVKKVKFYETEWKYLYSSEVFEEELNEFFKDKENIEIVDVKVVVKPNLDSWNKINRYDEQKVLVTYYEYD